ncbi:glutamate-5-semialdehyde dehydrogenase [Candidatus Peregrinibacteria bacterium]|nr:glutamate-5-semialdehyde dehydrogenase [Candidatus Peregrinibacteria bacterium]
MTLTAQAQAAKNASKQLALLSTESKNKALEAIASSLLNNMQTILEANCIDMKDGEKAGLGAMLDRLMLDEKRLKAISCEVLKVAELKDYVGEVIEDRVLANGIHLQRIRVPIGVIGCIIESRPNVTVDIATLCIKSGNAAFIKGGSEAIHSNRAIIAVIQDALKNTGVPSDSIQFLDSTDRAQVSEFLTLNQYIDLMIPRGSQKLVKFVMAHSTIPVLGAGGAVVHIFVDEHADISKALDIVVNSKTRRVSICNTLDNLLAHEKIAEKFLPQLAERLREHHVEIRADEPAFKILSEKYEPLRQATKNDWDSEYLDYILGIKIVENLEEALSHISKHSLKHTESIVTENKENAELFLQSVDSACVYHNMSTQFSDGGEFGLGAEVAISTQKLHARGPFALEGLTTYKWIGRGNGQTRAS